MVNLVSATAWTKSTSGTVTTGTTISISPTGAAVSWAMQAIPTEAGSTYVWSFHVDTTFQPFRAAGSTSAGNDVVPIASAVPGLHSVQFVATGSTTWIQFQRTTLGETRVSRITVEKKPEDSHPARQLDGATQYFQLNAATLGLAANNYNWYVGGWIRFNIATAGGVYVADFGRADPSGGLPNGRVRLVAGTGTDVKLFASTVLASGSNYRENAVTTTIDVGTWYYVGMYVTTSADIQLVWGATQPSTKTGTVPPLQVGTVCQVLQLGARVSNPPTSFAPCSYSDWVWMSGSLPTAGQISALAGGARPNEITGFAPTYWWPMAMSGTTEASLNVAQALTAVGSPPQAVGPGGSDLPASGEGTPLDIIVI